MRLSASLRLSVALRLSAGVDSFLTYLFSSSLLGVASGVNGLVVRMNGVERRDPEHQGKEGAASLLAQRNAADYSCVPETEFLIGLLWHLATVLHYLDAYA